MVTFRHKGDFSKLTSFLVDVKETVRHVDLDKYGREGVAALASATPKDTGLTASSWSYKIEQKNGSVTIAFYHYPAIRTWNPRRRLGPGKRLHQPCDPAYF